MMTNKLPLEVRLGVPPWVAEDMRRVTTIAAVTVGGDKNVARQQKEEVEEYPPTEVGYGGGGG